LTAAQRALALLFKKLNFGKAGQIKIKGKQAYVGKTSACRNTGGWVDQAAQRAGDEGDRMREALVAWAVNGVSREAVGGTANLICRQASISDGSGILF